MICKSCLNILEAFENFHQVAVSSQETILKALTSEKTNKAFDEKALVSCTEKAVTSFNDSHETMIQVEFLSVENEIEVVDACELSNDETEQIATESYENARQEPRNELFVLECNFCSKTYKRESHLKRHIEKLHKDGIVKISKKLENFLCNLCGKKFVKEDHYIEHVKKISCVPSITPSCRFCNENFLNIPKLQYHLSVIHPDGRKHWCQICFKFFPTASNKNSHMETHNPENSIICKECNQGFKSVLYLRKHQKTIHTKVEKVCRICDRKFESQQKFDYHVKSHDTVKRYKCDYEACDKSFMQHHHLQNHKTTHSGQSKYLCFKCGKEFKQDCNLKAHLKNHESEKEIEKNFKCSYENCGKIFKSNSSLRSHKQTHQKLMNTQCPECGKKFAQKSSLRAHFQTHFRNPENKLFKCSQPNCDRSFYQERSLTYHARTTHGIGEPPAKKASNLTFFCDFCSEAFKLQSLLKRHLLTHIEEEMISRKHQCDKCEARFKRPEHLRLHINSVHLKHRPYKCEKCDKSFTQVGDRNIHQKIHSNDRPHVCFCLKAFRLAKGLKAHLKTHENSKIQGDKNYNQTFIVVQN